MKRILPVLLWLVLLTGCSFLAPDEYLSVTPHQDSTASADTVATATAENFLTLKTAILDMVRHGQSEGVIRVTEYDGNVEADLTQAVYEVAKVDPLGSYAIDYISHSCTQIVSYYDIRIDLTFRRSMEEIAAIQSCSTQGQLTNQLYQALENYEDVLALRMISYRGQDQQIPQLVADYCAAHPDTIMEVPTVSIQVYSDTGNIRILEIRFAYTHTKEELQQMKQAVEESLHAAAEYIRYQQSDTGKMQLLFTYLTQRFPYTEEKTSTPLYDALCRGVADPTGLSQAWQLICNLTDVECYTVSGLRNSEPYTWNIVSADGYYRHLDLARCILDPGVLLLWNDWNMNDYYWNTDLYPACDPPAAPAEPEEEVPADPIPEEQPEETPEEQPEA